MRLNPRPASPNRRGKSTHPGRHGPRGHGVVRAEAQQGLQQQAAEPGSLMSPACATMEQGPRQGGAAVTVMLAGQREVLFKRSFSFQEGGRGGGGEGGGGPVGASLPALGESLPSPSHWSPQGFTSWFMRTFICLPILLLSLRSLKKSA